MQAVILITHIESDAVGQHFDRLNFECSGLLDAFLCVHGPAAADAGKALRADFRISPADEQRSLPLRYAEKMRRGGSAIPGFPDLIYMPVLRDRLTQYTHIWIMEYDVDFAGAWGDFFAPLIGSAADLMGTTIYPRSQCADWMWWPSFETPTEVSDRDHMRAFFPIARFSRRMIECYAAAVQTGDWRGHAEALYPTVARHRGLTIEDIGGDGPFTPKPLRGKNYFNNPADGRLRPGSLTTRPPQQTLYFHVAPETFPMRGYLYHPVKVHDGLDAADPIVDMTRWANDPTRSDGERA